LRRRLQPIAAPRLRLGNLLAVVVVVAVAAVVV
jgi:hypothetical protein